MGWKNNISLDKGLNKIYNNFEKEYRIRHSKF